jgi:hypothetical protein
VLSQVSEQWLEIQKDAEDIDKIRKQDRKEAAAAIDRNHARSDEILLGHKAGKRAYQEALKKEQDNNDTEEDRPKKRVRADKSSVGELTVKIESDYAGMTKKDWQEVLGSITPKPANINTELITFFDSKLKNMIEEAIRTVSRASPPGPTFPRFPAAEGHTYAPDTSPDPRYPSPDTQAKEMAEYRALLESNLRAEQEKTNKPFKVPDLSFLGPGETLATPKSMQDILPSIEKGGHF